MAGYFCLAKAVYLSIEMVTLLAVPNPFKRITATVVNLVTRGLAPDAFSLETDLETTHVTLYKGKAVIQEADFRLHNLDRARLELLLVDCGLRKK